MPSATREAADVAMETDDPIRDEDELVRTGEEDVRTTEDAVKPGVITLGMAADALRDELGGLVGADYLPGKTAFRDVLCARLDVSEETAEELVDDLENARMLRYVDSREEGAGWHVHVEELLRAA